MILNLAYPDKSEIKYKISKFPDGQQTVDLDVHESALVGKIIQIKSRLNSFKDLELIICANQALKNLGADRVHLYVPYFTGARSDRKFQTGGVNYLKQVICPIVNSQNFASVTVMDPHSDVLEACLNNFVKFNNFDLVDDALSYLIKDGEENKVALISPDAGALKKIYDVAKYFEIENVTTAAKVRDLKSGKILRTELPTMDLDGIEHFIIIDDICDGGRTFIELAKEIRKQTDKPIYLVVTHGIFSSGFLELSQHINGIFSTNSISDIDAEERSEYTVSKGFLKQLNVF